MPRIGTPMLFAYTDDDGRIAVVRTGPLSRFETLGPPRESRDEIPVDWVEDEAGPEDADDTAEDALEDAMTVPLHQSGERKTPRRISLFDRDEAHGGDPWVPPRRPSWATMTAAAHVRLQKVDIVPPRGSAPTLKRTSKPTATASAKGMLPKRTVR